MGQPWIERQTTTKEGSFDKSKHPIRSKPRCSNSHFLDQGDYNSTTTTKKKRADITWRFSFPFIVLPFFYPERYQIGLPFQPLPPELLPHTSLLRSLLFPPCTPNSEPELHSMAFQPALSCHYRYWPHLAPAPSSIKFNSTQLIKRKLGQFPHPNKESAIPRAHNMNPMARDRVCVCERERERERETRTGKGR